MKRKVTIFIDEIYSKTLMKNNDTKKTDVYYIDDTCSSDALDLNDFVAAN